MAEIEEALRDRLLAVAGVAAIVGARVYPKMLPQNPVLDAIVYQLVTREEDHSHNGSSGLAFSRIQIDCWSAQYSGSKALAAQVRLALEGFKGTVTGVSIQAAHKLSEEDLRDAETKLFRVSQDWNIHHDVVQP